MQQGGVRKLFLLASLMVAACTTPHIAPEPPTAVAVTFDRLTATPEIVEGLADRGTDRAVEANDPVRIASISKLIMAMATFELAAEGKVDPGADISEYLGYEVRNPAFPDAPVTLLQLLTHRSGLRDRAGYVIPLGESLQEHLAKPDAWYAAARPGEAPFEYANLGSPVVATVLEAASGERYDRLVERLIFAPLEIEACFNWIGCEQATVDRAVVLYRSSGEVARDDAPDLPPNCTFPVAEGVDCSIEDYVPGTNASIFSPQGGVRIGMMDLAKLGQAWLQRPAESRLAERTYREMLSSVLAGPQGEEFFCGYGAGIQLIGVPGHGCNDSLFDNGNPRFGHAGEAYGLRSGLWFDPKSGTGVAYFVTAVPDRTAPDEGGFAPEEIALVRRAMQKASETGK